MLSTGTDFFKTYQPPPRHVDQKVQTKPVSSISPLPIGKNAPKRDTSKKYFQKPTAEVTVDYVINVDSDSLAGESSQNPSIH